MDSYILKRYNYPTMTDSNLTWHKAIVTRSRRAAKNQHPSFILWFTGLSGAGKSTLAHYVEERLFELGCHTFVFDGDNVRHGLCKDLQFSPQDRQENIRRIGEMSKLFIQAGTIAITAFISPFKQDRDQVRTLVPDGDFIEVYCNADLAVCESRDVKGLYQQARQGDIKEFTGISSPYEAPDKAEIIVNTGSDSLETCGQQIIDYLIAQHKITPQSL
jgi:adenylylsulfate kinase